MTDYLRPAILYCLPSFTRASITPYTEHVSKYTVLWPNGYLVLASSQKIALPRIEKPSVHLRTFLPSTTECFWNSLMPEKSSGAWKETFYCTFPHAGKRSSDAWKDTLLNSLMQKMSSGPWRSLLHCSCRKSLSILVGRLFPSATRKSLIPGSTPGIYRRAL